MSDFNQSFIEVLSHEGAVYVNQPLDRGGPTKYGVTIATLNRYRKVPVSFLDIHNLTLDEAKQIYRSLYWNQMKLDQVQSNEIATCLLDQGILRGCEQAVLDAQSVLSLKTDGDLGPITLKALNSASPPLFILKFIQKCQKSLIRIVENKPDQIKFLEGWITRTQDLLSYSLTSLGLVKDNPK